MIYTGIGSRETPPNILKKMKEIAFYLAQKDFTLRSGKAAGADAAFQLGVQEAWGVLQENTNPKGLAEIYIPWPKFSSDGLLNTWDICVTQKQIVDKAESIASVIHPAWDKCSQGAKKLHTRNIYQVLGQSLDKPSDFLICYAKPTKDGLHVQGGTATAVKLALENNIPVFNLYNEEALQQLRDFIKEKV